MTLTRTERQAFLEAVAPPGSGHITSGGSKELTGDAAKNYMIAQAGRGD